MSDLSNTRTELSLTEIYMYELKSNNGISLCDNTLKKFILQDFCVQRKCLKVSYKKLALKLYEYFMHNYSHVALCLSLVLESVILVTTTGCIGVAMMSGGQN